MVNHPLGEECFSNTQPKPPLAQLQAILSLITRQPLSVLLSTFQKGLQVRLCFREGGQTLSNLQIELLVVVCIFVK